MSAYILFTESMVYFTPNSTTHDHEHVTIGVTAPEAITKRNRRDARTGRRETAVYIPYDFTGKFVVNIAVDHNPRQRYVAKWFRIRVTAENGTITEIINIRDDYPDDEYESTHIKVRFPSGYWYELGTDWIASIMG